MRTNKRALQSAGDPAATNVVNLFSPRKRIDPLQNEGVLEACRDYFSRGDLTPSGKTTNKILKLSRQDQLDYGMLGPILLARSPCNFDTHQGIYIKFLCDARLPRFCHFIFCAHINNRTLTRKLATSLIGSVNHLLTERIGSTADECIDELIDEGLCTEENGELKCTRRLAYYMIEMLAYLVDAMNGWGSFSRSRFEEIWDADGSTNWVQIDAPLEKAIA